MSTVAVPLASPSRIRMNPARSSAGRSGASFDPASIAGDPAASRQLAAGSPRCGSTEMLPLVPVTAWHPPVHAGPAALNPSLLWSSGGVALNDVSHTIAGLAVVPRI